MDYRRIKGLNIIEKIIKSRGNNVVRYLREIKVGKDFNKFPQRANYFDCNKTRDFCLTEGNEKLIDNDNKLR